MGNKANQNNTDNQLQEATEVNLHEPNMFKVLLLNDDYTPMDFVVDVLKGFFDMDEDQATQVMLHVHTRGKGMCGIFSHEVAETKTALVNDYSRAHQHPLLCVLEMV